MKLLFAIKGIHNLAAGAERVICDVASNMAERGHKTTLLTFDQEGAAPFFSLSEKVKTLYLSIGIITNKTTPAHFIRRILKLRQIILYRKPDVVIAFMHSMYIPMSLALIGTGIPIIASEHTALLYYKNQRFQFFMIRITYVLYNTITVLSKKILKSYPKKIQSKMIEIPNPIKIPKKRAMLQNSCSVKNIILSVGRLNRGKNHETLISAFKSIANDFPNWNLKIIGEGNLRLQLEQMIKDYGMEERIELPGVVQNIWNEYFEAKIFVIPSVYEGFPLVLAEAMSAGLPSIGFADCPGVNELISTNNDGLLIKGNNRTKNMAEALKMLIISPQLRQQYGTNARISIKNRYSPEKIFDLWENLCIRTANR